MTLMMPTELGEPPRKLGAAAWDGLTSSLLGPSPFVPQDLAQHCYEYGPPPIESARGSAEQLLSASGGLLGRGGAAFPTSVKMRAVEQEAARTGLRPVVVANGAEGEPLSVKDRYLLRYRPHWVLEGLLAVAEGLDASSAYVYVADRVGIRSTEAAVAELSSSPRQVPIQVFAAQETYVAGEESAVVRAIERGIARPTDKPPRVFQVGVGGAPTLVLNVETLARIAQGLRDPSHDPSQRLLITVSGGSKDPCLYEVPADVSLGDLMRTHFGHADSDLDVLVGGFFGGIIPAWPDLRLNHADVRRRGAGLGCGSLHFTDPAVCPVKTAADVAGYYAVNNARQCGMCIASTGAVASALEELGAPAPHRKNYAAVFPRWAAQVHGRGACAVPDAVGILIRSLLRFFPEVLARHFARGCDQCASGAVVPGPRWAHLAVPLPEPDQGPAAMRPAAVSERAGV